MEDAARDGLLVEVRCNACQRKVAYWAVDLRMVLGPDHPVHVAPFACSACRTRDFLDVRCRVPSVRELADGLTVRRPVKQVVKWIWRNERA
ncbi:hypothetical protein OEW28_17330 [Defluviimonas sp. WL0002]|uniref:Uncharacterized protein n=1 Tax=Albidovulum marisflavi TaxID=2984159 RepID=A0ABT2ZGY4_9RHOB|nr:hypothetical protein [Defluviimonas sp. WL0002]MCV2870379.1 hypothetical protein [Defluviimonas sp. WL0002]